MWLTQSNLFILMQTVQMIGTEVLMMRSRGADYFKETENVRDWLRILLSITFLGSTYMEMAGRDMAMYRMLHFANEDYFSNWNMVDVNSLSFSMIILNQWLSVSVRLQ